MKKIPAGKDKNLWTANISCISAQKGVAFFVQMVYNRPTGRERLERTYEFIWLTMAISAANYRLKEEDIPCLMYII